MPDGDPTSPAVDPTDAVPPAWPPPTPPMPPTAPPSPSTADAPAEPPAEPVVPEPPVQGPPPLPGPPSQPTSWAPPPARTGRKLTWLWVVLSALGLLAIVVAGVVFLFVRSLKGPIDATNIVLAEIRRGDYPAAYRDSCARTRATLTLDTFGRTLDDTQATRGHIQKYDVNYASVHGSHANVRYTITFAKDGDHRFESQVLKEHGKWHVCLLEK